MPETMRRRVLEDDEYDTPPRRRRVVTTEDDDIEEPRRPRRRRQRVQDDEDAVEEAPRGRRRRSAVLPENDDVEDAPRGRHPVLEDDEEDGVPRGRRQSRGGSTRRQVARGWGAYERSRAAASDVEPKFKPGADGSVVALLEEDPFASFGRHWVELSSGKRPLICPRTVWAEDDEDEAECPLCDIGDKPQSPRAYLNVAVMSPTGSPSLAVWEIGSTISDQLQMIDKGLGKRTSLTDIYIEARSKGSGLNTKYTLEPIFPEDLVDYNMEPLTAKQRARFELYNEALYEVPTLRELNQAADEIA